ncbi:MAG: Brp/Blh family beta-carotene 15,15'-dioxygenase [Bacteroidota bacterium]
MKHPNKILIQCAIGAFALAINLLFPEWVFSARYYFLALVILLIGMPHGALDHIIDGNLEGWNPFTLNLKFYGWYLTAIAAYALVWVFFPLFSFAFFLAITWYHFGQADAERFTWTGWKKHLIHFSRGLTVVGLIVFGDLTYASSVIEAVTAFSVETWLQERTNTDIIRWGIAGWYPAVFLLLSLMDRSPVSAKLIYALDAVMVPVLFLYADPVWAFGIYFGLWHSYNHVLVMLGYLRSEGKTVSFSWFYKYSFNFSLLSYLGLLFIYNLLNAFGQEELLVALLFVVISVLTLPHLMVVEKLYSTYKS